MSRRHHRPLPQQLPLLMTLGDTGLKEFGGKIREEFHKDLKADRWLKTVKEMIYNESNLSTPYLLIEMMVRSTERFVEPADTGHPQAQEAAEFVEQCLDDMESTLQEVLTSAVSAVPYGYAYLEVLYKIRKGESSEPRLNSKYTDGRYGWRDWSIRAQESREEWAFSDEGRLLGMWQRVETRPELLFIPIDKALHFRFRGLKDNPEGFSFFRPAYPSYHFGTRKRITEAIALERDGAGVPDYQVPLEIMAATAGTAEAAIRTAAENTVRKFRFDQLSGIVRPSEVDTRGQPTGYKFGFLSASGKNIQAYDTSIRRDQHEMLKTFMTQFLAFGISQEGSHALGDSMTSMFGYAINAINKSIDEEITRAAIPGLMRLEGYPPAAWPKYKSGDVEKMKLEVAGTFVNSILSAGGMEMGKDIDDWARKQIGLKPKEGPSTDDILGSVVGDVTPPPDVSATEPVEESADPDPGGNGGEVPHQMMDLSEAADYFGVSRQRLRNAVNRGQLVGVPIGNTIKFKRAEIENLFAMVPQ